MSEIADPVVTPDPPPPLDVLAATATAREYREARTAKPVLEPVAEPVAEPEPDADAKPAIDASEAGRQLAAHKSGLDKRKASIQTEIDLLTRTKHDTKREADLARVELDGLNAALAAAKTAQQPEPTGNRLETDRKPTGDPEPTADQFDSYDKYVKAQARWEARQEIQQEFAAERTRTAQASQQSDLQRATNAIYDDGVKDFPDFEALVAQAHTDRFGFSPDLSVALAGLPHAHRVAHALLTDRVEAQRLNALTGVTLGISLAAVVQRLAGAGSGPAVETPPETQATAPIKPVGTAPTASSRSLETVAKSPTNADYRRAREARAR